MEDVFGFGLMKVICIDGNEDVGWVVFVFVFEVFEKCCGVIFD